MSTQSVLISGAGIAGSTLAYWLGTSGYDVTVVERSSGLRSSGNPVDVRGPAMAVVERMGLLDELERSATGIHNMVVVNARGRVVARIPTSVMQDAPGQREFELPRRDLSAVLLAAARPYSTLLFDDSISSLRQDADGVEVTFQRGAPRRFDIVIGADGQHSIVRRLAFEPDANVRRHLGMYVATLPLGGQADDPDSVVLYNVPGRSISIHPSTGEPIVAFIFRGSAVADFDYRDLEQHKRIITDAYANDGWKTPDLLRAVRKAPDLYFDAISQIRLSEWSVGRIGLLGDAASSVSLFGEGSSLAIAGAATLAECLAKHPGDPQTALREYEVRHRTLVDPRQKGVESASRFLVPRSRAGIAFRNLVLPALPALRRWVPRRSRPDSR